MTYSAKAQGWTCWYRIPKSGTVISPRAVGIMKDSKNVKVQKSFIELFLSDDVQNKF